jgi:type I restriction enzyme S subunit
MGFLLKDPRLVSQFYRNSQGLVSDTWNLRYREFKVIEIMLPSLEEQRRIAEILDGMDTHIERLERLARKERIARRAELLKRFYGTATARFRVRDLLKSRPRNGYSPKEVDTWNGTLMLGLGCLTPAGFSPKQLKFAPEDIDCHHRAILRDGDLLVSRANTRELVGLAGVYRDVGNPCIYPDLMMRLEPIDEVPSEMLELALSIPESRRRIQAQAQGTSESMAKITSDVIMNLEVPMPDSEGRRSLMQALEDANRSDSVHDAAIQKATDIKKGLATDLVARAVSCVSQTA